jgi:hypothetical protein
VAIDTRTEAKEALQQLKTKALPLLVASVALESNPRFQVSMTEDDRPLQFKNEDSVNDPGEPNLGSML